MDKVHTQRQQELEEQLSTINEWDDYEPDKYGWENSRILSLQHFHMVELSNELGPISIPHKTRCFQK